MRRAEPPGVTEQKTTGFTVRPLKGMTDPALAPWLDLYQTTFPLQEQVLISAILRAVRDADGTSLLLAATSGNEFLGLAWIELHPPVRAAALWYLAVAPHRRGRGLGRHLFGEAVRRARAAEPGLRAVVLEVERPDLASSAEERAVRDRRIAFYQRAGCILRDDVPYVQATGWQPPVPMHLMVLPLEPMTRAEQRSVLVSVLGLEPTRQDKEA